MDGFGTESLFARVLGKRCSRGLRTAGKALAVAALPWIAVSSVGCQSGAGTPMVQSQQANPAMKSAAAERVLLIADTYAQQGQAKKAERLYSQVLRANPGNRRAVAGLNLINPKLASRFAEPTMLEDISIEQSGRSLVALDQVPARSSRGTKLEFEPATIRRQTAVIAVAEPREEIEFGSAPAVASQAARADVAVEPTFDDSEFAEFAATVESPAVEKPQAEFALSETTLADSGKRGVAPADSGVEQAFEWTEAEPAADEPAAEEPTAFALSRDGENGAAKADASGIELASLEVFDDAAEFAEEQIDDLHAAAFGDAVSEVGAAAEVAVDEQADAEPSGELPVIRPFGSEMVDSAAGYPPGKRVTPKKKSESVVSIEVAKPDLTPAHAEGWEASQSPRTAPDRELATLTQLGELKAAATISPADMLLAHAACDHRSPEVRLAAAEAVLTHRPHDADAWGTVDALIADADAGMTSLAALTIGSLPEACHREVMPRLMDLLRSDDADAQSAAALAIGGLGESARPAIGMLRTMAAGGQGQSEAAAISLKCLGQEI